jgi:4-diphosphocytidyl-2-C-methyl-D-erythritol kinase
VTSASRVFVSAPAKVNLCLHVGAKRSDGYHDLESFVAFAFHDDGIWVEPDDRFSLTVKGPFGATLPDGEDNLILKAARLLAEKAAVREGARITLQKMIPVSSGLGGGSADAAAVLRGLERIWNLHLGRETLHEIAALLGADVPVCLESAAAWIEGRGERVTLLPPLPKLWLLLVNPGVPVSTADVFASLDRRRGVGLVCPRAPFEDVYALTKFLRSTNNDLEAPAIRIAPIIGDVLQALVEFSEVLIARMSGSGATCFALFESAKTARSVMVSLKEKHPTWWVIGSALAPEGLGAGTLVQ